MGVDKADTRAKELEPLDHGHDLGVARDMDPWKLLEFVDERLAISQRSHCNFANDQGMQGHTPQLEQFGKRCQLSRDVIDPDRGIG